MATSRTGGGRRPTFTETARRAQLIEVTIDQVAAKGYASTSLGGIAEAAGITKAAVLYHFATKDTLVDAAYQQVLHALTSEVAAAVEAADASQGPAAYVRSMVRYLHEHPRHTRMIIESLTRDGSDHEPQERWEPLARLITAAAAARGTNEVDVRTLALIVNGAIDAIVTEHLYDPDYDTASAANQVVELIELTLTRVV